MWFFKKNVKKVLCSETDDKKIALLSMVLKNLGAELLNKERAIVGSQDILSAVYLIHNEKITIISETYEGVILHGPEQLVDEIIDRVNTSQLA